MTKGNGVTHFTELHRTLHKNFLIWRWPMPEALIFLRCFRESAYLLTVYQVSLPSTVEVVVQPAPRVILPVLALTGSTVVTPGL